MSVDSPRPTGHDGPCCSSCLDDIRAYDEGEIDHSHDMHPLCCCLDKRDDEVAQKEYDEWIAAR